jgi:PPOX class probable FMN-dependent enzyme
MSEWIGELQSAISREFGDKPAVATLATIDKAGAPRARTVICRRVTDDGSIVITSDSRTEKVEQLKASPQAEIVIYLPNLREQYRVLGAARIIGSAPSDAPLRQELWRGLSDSTRATFHWPSPGARKIDPDDSFAIAVNADQPIPQNFDVIVIRPKRVEHLQLWAQPHRRRRWMLAGKWSAASELNP